MTQKIQKRDFSKFVGDEFKQDLLSHDWSQIYNSTDTNSSFKYFFESLNNLLNEHAPLKTLTKREVTLKSKPWIDFELQKLMRQRDKKCTKIL